MARGNGDRPRRCSRFRRRGSAVSAIGVTPLEMADAYATLANGGIHHDPTAISKVEFPDGKVDEFETDSGERVLTEGQAYEVTRILEGVITQGTGAGYTSMGCTAPPARPAPRRKHSDAWFVGYTPLFSTAVWVGHPTRPANTPASAAPPPARSGANYMSSRGRRRMPRIRGPGAACPSSIRPRQRTHLSRATDGYEEEETFEGEEEATSTRAKTRKTKTAGEEASDPEATPEATPERGTRPDPEPPPPRRRRHQRWAESLRSELWRRYRAVQISEGRRPTLRSARSGSRPGRGRSRCGGPRCGRRGGRAAFPARCLRAASRSRVASRSSTPRAMWL